MINPLVVAALVPAPAYMVGLIKYVSVLLDVQSSLDDQILEEEEEEGVDYHAQIKWRPIKCVTRAFEPPCYKRSTQLSHSS